MTVVIILAGDSVDEAHRRMIQSGVRLLLVVDQDRKAHGVITANDVVVKNRCRRRCSAVWRVVKFRCGIS